MIHHLEAELLQILSEGSSFLRDVSMQLQQDRRLFLCHFIKHCSHLLLCELNGTGDFFMNGLLNGATLTVDELRHCSHLLLCELNGTGDFFMNGLLNGATFAVDELSHCSHLLLCELNGTGDFFMN